MVLQEIFWQFENFQIYKGLYAKPLKRDWVARVVFPIKILLIKNFQRPLQSQLLKYTAENLQVTLLKYALSVSVDNIFQKQTVFIFSESWSHDQLMQKAYWERMVIFQTQFHRPLHSSGTTLFKQNTNVWDFYNFWDSVIQFEYTRV